MRKAAWVGAVVSALVVACSTTRTGGPFQAEPPTSDDDGDASFGGGGGEPTPESACPYPPPSNGASCASIDKGRDFELTCVYEPCGGEADPSPGSPYAFVAVCFRKTWTLIPADAGDVCLEPRAVDAGLDADADADLDLSDAADASDD